MLIFKAFKISQTENFGKFFLCACLSFILAKKQFWGYRHFKNAMHVYAAELICSMGVLGFQTFKPVFCMYNKLCLHAQILS